MILNSLRTLRRSPGLTVYSVLVLGLGIGGTVATFSTVNALLIRPLPYPHGDKIVRVMNRVPKQGLRRNVSGPDFLDWRAQSHSFAAMAHYRGGEMAITVNGQGIFTESYSLSPDFFKVFEVAPLMGRLPEADTVAISHGFWQQHYGGAAGVLGQTVKLSQKTYTIAGVMPKSFAFPPNASVWTLEEGHPETDNRTANNFRAIARIENGVDLRTAEADIETVAARMAIQHPDTNKDRSAGLMGLRDQLSAPYRDGLGLLMAAAILILLIACANVSNLVLAKAQSRQREFAVRASLGASSARILWMVVGESLALGLASGVVGIVLAHWMTQALAGTIETAIDWRVLAFAAIVATLSSLLFSLYPAWKVSRVDLTGALKTAGQKGMVGGGSGWFRRGLAIGQVALSLTMLCGALLLARSMSKLMGVDMGLDANNVLVSYMHVPADKLEDHIAATRVFTEILRELRQSPAVASASAVMGMPTGKYGSDGGYSVIGQPPNRDRNKVPQAGFRVAAPGFFDTMRIPLKRGRDFVDGDALDRPFVAIVNETLAKRAFPNSDPIGQQIQCGLDNDKLMTIVGVVGDVRHDGMSGELNAELYMPMNQHPYHGNELQVVIRAKGDPAALSELARAVAAKRNPDIAVNSITFESMLNESVAAPRLRTLLLIVMAGLATILAAAGVYGVLAFLVSQRLSEFGLRIALGAQRRDILALVWREAALLLGGGFALGLLLIFALGGLVRGFLFGVQPQDAVSIGAAAALLGAAAIIATALPSLGATRSDPMTVLRSE